MNLTDDIRNIIKPVVEGYISTLENIKVSNEAGCKDTLELTNQGVSPIQLKELLEELGYEEQYPIDSNGWEYDFWWYFTNPNRRGCAQVLCICGCGIAFHLTLRSGADY